MRFITTAAMLLLCSPALAQTGPARVVDGDTLVIAGQKVRLWGIDAPERSQKCQGLENITYMCGKDATAVMTELTKDRMVYCVKKSLDRYKRIVATCSVEDKDLGAMMVQRGWAVDYTQYSRGAYASQQKEAEDGKLGIWSGRFELPSKFRKDHGK